MAVQYRFKKGDLLICKETDFTETLIEDEIYTYEKPSEKNPDECINVSKDGKMLNFGYYHFRFRLYENKDEKINKFFDKYLKQY